MAEKSTRTKMLEEAEIKDDPLMLKRALRGAGVGISKLADKAGFTQEEEYKKMEEKKKKRAGGMTKMKASVSASKRADGIAKKGKTKGRMV